jgi:ribosomal protein L7Ae-like RNA K-turn-binding protein
MSVNEKTLGFLGLLYRGREVVIGEAILEKMPKGFLLLLASDAASGTVREYLPKAEHAGVKTLTLATKAELGRALGHDEVSAILILSKKAAAKILQVEGNNHEETK